MTPKQNRIYAEGKAAAALGLGASDNPYGGRDGFLWHQGLLAGIAAEIADDKIEFKPDDKPPTTPSKPVPDSEP